MQSLKDEVESLRNERALLRNDLREAAETVSIFIKNPELSCQSVDPLCSNLVYWLRVANDNSGLNAVCKSSLFSP